MDKKITPTDQREILAEIKNQYNRLSKSHKKVADYILKHYEKVPDRSAINIAKILGLSEATVVRFALSLGFEGYPEFRRELRDEVNSILTTVERIDLSQEENQRTKDTQDFIRCLIRNDLKNLGETLNGLDYDTIETCARILYRARRVVILGYRTTAYLSEHLGYYLKLLLDDVRVFGLRDNNTYGELLKVEAEDVVIAMSFPRYAKKTYDVVRYLRRKGPKVITITDSDHAPIVGLSDYQLYAKSDVYSFMDSLVAPLSLINGLVVAVGQENIDQTKSTFCQLEEVWRGDEIYFREELEGE